jgi:hypothetical protein
MKKIKIKVHPQKKVNSEINNKKEGKFKTRFKKEALGKKY